MSRTVPLAALRAFLIIATISAFFLVGVPLQWLIAQLLPRLAQAIPAAFCRSLLALLGVKIVREGRPTARRPLLIAANHVSWLDILAFASCMPVCFLAKKDVASWPILSAFAEVQGTVFVDRKRRRSIPGANRGMAAQMRAGRAVLLFPEGTTVAPPVPGHFRSSHFAAARDLLAADASVDTVAVQPVAVAFSHAGAAWIGDDALVPHVWRVLRAPPLTCTLAFGAPLPCSRDTDRKALAHAAHAAIEALLMPRSTQDRIAARHARERAAACVGDVAISTTTPS